MKVLTNDDIKKMSVIMIDTENGNSEPYFVVDVGPGAIPGSTKFTGERLEYLIRAPHLYSENPHKGMDWIYALGEPNRINLKILRFREIEDDEKKKWLEKLKPFSTFKKLIDILNT
jgi:hypothetical protein